MEFSELKKLYSILEVIHITNIGKTSIYNEINKGSLVAKHYGNRTLITAESLESFIRNLPEKSINRKQEV